MPEFILDHGSPEASKIFKSLDAFTQGYVEAMFWTDANWDSEANIIDASFDELAPQTLTNIIEECRQFQLDNVAALDMAYNYDTYSPERAGHDYWFTRNRHGTGFWDRGLGVLGKRLTKSAHAGGDANLYRGDDGLLYLA